METFARLKKLRLTRSAGGRPYRLTVAGARAVNAQFDNQWEPVRWANTQPKRSRMAIRDRLAGNQTDRQMYFSSR